MTQNINEVSQLELFSVSNTIKSSLVNTLDSVKDTTETTIESKVDNENTIVATLDVLEVNVKDKQCKRLQSKYGISLEEKQNIHALQKGKCDICKQPHDIDNVVVDHDHTSGLVRGLLCSPCNLMLGHGKDSISTLQKAIEYLDNSRQYTIIRGKKSVVLRQDIYN